jgi:hypothetical protein
MVWVIIKFSSFRQSAFPLTIKKFHLGLRLSCAFTSFGFPSSGGKTLSDARGRKVSLKRFYYKRSLGRKTPAFYFAK